MAQQANAHEDVWWAAKVLAIFVLVGGVVGGAAIGIVFIGVVLATASGQAAETLAQTPQGLFAMSVVGLVVGFPAAFATGLAMVGAPSLRERWRITAFAVVASAVWGALFGGMLSPQGSSVANMFWLVTMFAGAGAAATLACYSLLRLLRLAGRA